MLINTIKLPSLAVIIPAHNAEKYLRRAVQSVWTTGYANVQVVIVDDGSTDQTEFIAEQLCSENPMQCTLLQHPNKEKHGVSASRNLGITQTQSEWVAFLDADDAYLSNRFDCLTYLADMKMTKGFEQEVPDAFYGLTQVVSAEDGIDTINWWSRQSDHIFGIHTAETGSNLLKTLLQGIPWHTGAITVRRSLLEQVGYFDPNKRIAEDCDLWFRIASIGRVICIDDKKTVSIYCRHSSNTYQQKLENRLDMIRAMLDTWEWANKNQIKKEFINIFQKSVPDYVYRAIIVTREQNKTQVTWSILRMVYGSKQAFFFCDIRFLKQVRALLFC